ncbi:hypothetical protein Sango_0020400 [Sesamum angolense]|uniref:Aminotransferase-like plant mobile domain-containing protein n=1 Tax=Sesamum angolense TaxID=2727404 RepID=A0AAE2C574_9LAMI|nr:hypothetical protein Sango_0020400 [Sesamum angolense]
MLAVYAPLIGCRNVNPWSRLINSSHLSEWCQEISLSKNIKGWILRANHHEPPRHQPSDDFAHLCTLGRSIIEGDAKWDSDLHFTREFRYTKGYWEWTEDVLSRYGDRLRHLKIYDVVYASLFTYDHNFDIVKAFCEVWCPLTNTLLTSIGKMFISLWDLHELVGLPMTGCLFDEVVPKKKTVRSKSTHTPLGDIAIHERWSTAEEALLAKLCIERSLKEEVYLAAYLACWLCVFILPGKDINSIRPSTFKMASLMTNDRRVNLVILVLATDSSLSHIVLIDLDVNLAWFPCLPANAKKLCSKAYKAWWAKVHGTFSYDNIACLMRSKPIKITLKCKKNEDKQVDGGKNDPPHALIPPIVIECDSQAVVAEATKGKYSSHNVADSDSSNKDHHWKRPRKEVIPLKATETNENASRSSLGNFVAELEDEVQSIDVGEEFETSHSSTMTPPLGMGLRRKQSPPPTVVSVFKDIKYSVDFLSSIENDVYLILESMKSFQKFDVSKVEESLNTFFAKVHAYDEARSLSSKKLSRSLHEQQLKEVKARLQDVQAKASE